MYRRACSRASRSFRQRGHPSGLCRGGIFRAARSVLRSCGHHESGPLPNSMRVESVLAGGHPRSHNESMVHAMVVAGLIERRGRGWSLMRRTMRKFNNTEPGIVNDPQFVRVSFHFDRDSGTG